MSDKKPYWYAPLHAALKRHGYRYPSHDTLDELHARTGLHRTAITGLLEGDPDSSINSLILVCEMLNLPPGHLLNSDPGLLRIYAIDGASPITVVVPPDFSRLLTCLGSKPLMYANDIEDSVPLVGSQDTVICIRGSGNLQVGKLYLLETDSKRFVRRCVTLKDGDKEAVLSNGLADSATIVMPTDKLQLVTAETPLLLGQVIWAIAAVDDLYSGKNRGPIEQMG